MRLHELQSAIAARCGEPYAASWIAPGGLDPDRNVFTPKTGIAFDRLRGDPYAREVLTAAGVVMQHPRTSQRWP